MREHFAGPGMELNSATATPAQVGCQYGQTFRRKDLQRGPAIQSANGWLMNGTHSDGEDIGAAKKFYLQFVAADPQGVELFCQVTNGEVYVTLALRVTGSRRASGQNAMAQSSRSQAGTPERGADTGSKNGLQQHGTASQIDLPGLDIDRGQIRHHPHFL
jgi:hypothetical protein